MRRTKYFLSSLFWTGLLLVAFLCLILIKLESSRQGNDTSSRQMKAISNLAEDRVVTITRNSEANVHLAELNVVTMDTNNHRCPLVPPNLKGRIKVVDGEPTWEELNNRFTNLGEGGSSRPKECVPRQKVAILIPYRDRERHLRVFLNHYHPLLQRQQLDYAIYVIDLAPGPTFNRAMLLNIGFKEASKIDDYNCFIFHDVDFMAEDDRNIYACSDLEPRHMGVSLDIHKYKLLYPQYFGGTSAMTKEQFVLVNGFSNKFFGWGGEDDDMYYRIKQNKMTISRIESSIARYKMLSHKPDMEMNKDRWSMVKEVKKRWRTDGLNSLKYKVLSLQRYRLYTHIRVEIDQKEVMKS